jgi:hypothetical protein
VNNGNWDYIKHSKEVMVLILCVIEFVRCLQKPLLTDDEVKAMCDISVSSAVDRSVMGLMTSMADLVSHVIYPWQSQSPMIKEESKKTTMPQSRLSKEQETGGFSGKQSGLLSI